VLKFSPEKVKFIGLNWLDCLIFYAKLTQLVILTQYVKENLADVDYFAKKQGSNLRHFDSSLRQLKYQNIEIEMLDS